MLYNTFVFILGVLVCFVISWFPFVFLFIIGEIICLTSGDGLSLSADIMKRYVIVKNQDETFSVKQQQFFFFIPIKKYFFPFFLIVFYRYYPTFESAKLDLEKFVKPKREIYHHRTRLDLE
jgi:hypothetical protein